MKSKALFPTIAALFVICSCSEEVKLNRELMSQYAGRWQSNGLKIEMRSFRNTDSLRTFEVKAEEWENRMNIKPIVTWFNADGTYKAEHRNLKDSIVFSPAGRWSITNDTLHVYDTFPQPGPRYNYKLKITGNVAEIWGNEDCDGDGKSDDLYYGHQVRKL